MSVAVRRAGPADAESTTRLYLRARRAAAAAGSIPPLAHSDLDVSSWIANVVIPGRELWLAEDPRGTAVAMLVLEGEWIDQLYADPDLTSRGLGSQLLELAKRERPDGLCLWTFVSNPRAQRFYERNGFREVERTDGSRNEEGSPDIKYEWGLT
jgi:GNAT superfamily N-acetyltransferase